MSRVILSETRINNFSVLAKRLVKSIISLRVLSEKFYKINISCEVLVTNIKNSKHFITL
jgi:hypothetical protein